MEPKLYTAGSHADAKAPLLVHYFYGGMSDPGGACRLSLEQLRDTTIIGRVATFDIDQLLDYRSSRPLAKIVDYAIDSIEMPQIRLDLASDLSGNEFLLLHGAEPDFRWNAFTSQLMELLQKAEVKTCISLLSLPASAPHTRPAQVQKLKGSSFHNQSLLDQEQEEPDARMWATLTVFLTKKFAEAGYKSFGLMAAVPYYLVETDYFPGAAGLLRELAKNGNLNLPLGDLDAATFALEPQIEAIIAQYPESHEMIADLEMKFDRRMKDGGDAASGAPTMMQIPTEEEIGNQLDQFLRAEAAKMKQIKNSPFAVTEIDNTGKKNADKTEKERGGNPLQKLARQLRRRFRS